MKEQVQGAGVRKWFGDDFILLQDEIISVLTALFSQYSTPFILTGCEVEGTTISSGIIGLIHADGFKLCRFAGATGVSFPYYLKPTKTEITRQYLSGVAKAIVNNYAAEYSETGGTGYLEILADGSTARFNDIIQDTGHRFCNDTEKTSYAGQAASAIETIRGGVDEAYNTLKKLKDIIPSDANIEALKLELRGGVNEAYDTMKELYDYIISLEYLPTYKGVSVLSSSTIDWRGTPEQTIELTSAIELDASNLIEGKTIGLKVTGDYTLTFSSKFDKITGSPDPVPGATNYVQMKCINAASGSEQIIYLVVYLP